ncbi:MAG: S8/S53 family peptidase [Chlorobi bacterium]|nr:S8/S53 family peptidase [Chlorobiota bacterium]
MKIKSLVTLLLVLLLLSLFFNVKSILKTDEPWFVSFPDANSRPTYDTYHHIKEAQKLSTGKGIKVGILGKYFGYKNNKNIYSGGKDFTGNTEAFNDIGEHGLWMATTLKEIAPDVEIYALCARNNDHSVEAKAISEAVDWAIENDIDILTYSAQAFSEEYREEIDKAVRKAIEHNIVTTFIHYDIPGNILPFGFFPYSPKSYARETDLNVFHFDYNVLLLFSYKNYLESGRNVGNNIGAHPYFSNSSMSPVLAGIVAMMKEINNGLPASEYKRILKETSYELVYNGYKVKHVVDALGAVNYLLRANNEGS